MHRIILNTFIITNNNIYYLLILVKSTRDTNIVSFSVSVKFLNNRVLNYLKNWNSSPMITLKKSDLNSLIAKYLHKNGYEHSYFTFSAEVKVETSTNISLEQLVQMGLQYHYVETHIRDGVFIPCDITMSLTEEHVCNGRDNEGTENLHFQDSVQDEKFCIEKENNSKRTSPEIKTETKEPSVKEEVQSNKRIRSALTYQTVTGTFPEATICAWSGRKLALGREKISVFNESKQGGVFDMNTEVTALAWMDAKILGVGTYKGGIHFIDTEQQIVVHSVDAHKGPVFSIKSREDKLLTAGFDGNACIIENNPQHDLKRYSPHNTHCLDCEWISDSSFVTCSTDFNLALVTETLTEYLVGHVNTVNAISYRENIIASSSDDTTVILWNIETKKNVILNGHSKPVHTHKWGSQYLFSGSSDGDLFLWDVNKGSCHSQVVVGKRLNSIETMDNLCIVGTDKGIVFYDKVGVEVKRINMGGVWDVKGCDGKLAVCLEDNAAMVIDIRYG